MDLGNLPKRNDSLTINPQAANSLESQPNQDISPDDSNKITSANANTNGKLEQLEGKEKTLATKLKSLCTPSGEEKSITLDDSASVLLELGSVYMEKAKLGKGIEQKISFIRCAVLFHGAIVRFKIKENTEKILTARKLCNEMSTNVLKFSGSCNDTDLTDISDRLFDRVCGKRVEIQEVLDTDLCRSGENNPDFEASQRVSEKLELLHSLESISPADIERIFSPDRENKEKKIAERVKEVNEDVSSFYKGMLDDITAECLKLVPPAPCKFSIIGLGSLARKEVTLYSDFEHIILLEDGIEKRENYQDVLEYFRWFSVIFQIIVIGFGETIIPSVGVKSLNDCYSGDADANWYYDNYTLNGISFDGMLPHACKIPLGRQEPTPNRTQTVELIKPPLEMANYLTKKEQLLNGYHLADVLRQTCLVYGDDEIYSLFLEERNRIFEKDKTEVREMYAEMILDNNTLNVRNKLYYQLYKVIFDSKSVFYRPLATHLGVIARIQKIEEGPTFEIIDKLYARSILGPYTYNKLKYAFAVACELRMKLYHKVNQQRHGTHMTELEVMVGKETMLICRNMITRMRYLTEDLATRGNTAEFAEMEKIFTTPDTYHTVTELMLRDYNDEAIARCEKMCKNPDHDRNMRIKLEQTLFQSYFSAAIVRSPRRSEYIEKAEELYLKWQKRYAFHHIVDHDMAVLYFLLRKDRRRHYECMATYEKYFFKYFKALQHGDDHQGFPSSCHNYYTLVESSKDSPNQKDEKLETVLWDKSDNIECKLLKRLHLGRRYIQNDCADENVKRDFISLFIDLEKYIKKLVLPEYFQISIAASQVQMWWLKDAMETVRSASKHHKYTRSNSDKHREYYIGIMESLKLLCLCRLHGDKVARYLPGCNENAYEALSQHLFKILWRGIHLSEFKDQFTEVFIWALYFKTQGKLQNVFLAHRVMKDSEKKYKKAEMFAQRFVENCWKNTHVNKTEGVPFAFLLLADSL